MPRFDHDNQSRVIDRSRINQHNQAPPGIKCAICDAIYPLNIFQDHLNTHINPKFLTPSIKDNLAKKQKFTMDQMNTQDSDPAIKSFLPQQIPRAQNERKNIQAPIGTTITSGSFQQNGPNTRNIKIDARDVASNLGYLNEQSDSIDMLNIQKKLNIGIQTKQMYSNRKPTSKRLNNPTNVNEVSYKSGKKQLFIADEPQLNESKYEVNYQKTSSFNVPKEVQQQKSSMTVPINKGKKSISQHRSISTSLQDNSENLYQSRSIFPRVITDLSESAESQILKTTSRMPTRTCPDCGGFYCSTCHSTIPPQYSPANLSEKDELDPKIVAFYKQHVYTGTCKGCHTQK